MKTTELDALAAQIESAGRALAAAKAPAAMRRRMEEALLAVDWLRSLKVKR